MLPDNAPIGAHSYQFARRAVEQALAAWEAAQAHVERARAAVEAAQWRERMIAEGIPMVARD